MKGAAGSIGTSVDGEYDDVGRSADGTENCVTSTGHPVRITDEILGVRQPRLTERRVNLHGNAATRAAADQLTDSGVGGPLRGHRRAGNCRAGPFRTRNEDR
jgi:hypothetical protein